MRRAKSNLVGTEKGSAKDTGREGGNPETDYLETICSSPKV